MPIVKYKTGCVTECTESVIAHGTNCMGAMGAGVALAIKNEFPEAYDAYIAQFERGESTLGNVSYATSKGKFVVNLNTQRWIGAKPGTRYASYDAIIKALELLAFVLEAEGFSPDTCVAMPRIGCGLGGLKFEVVKPIIDTYFVYPVVIYDIAQNHKKG